MEWDTYFMDMADMVARNSKCLSGQVGAILVRDNSIVCTGYNGPPRGTPHCGKERIIADADLMQHVRSKNTIANPAICPRRWLNYKSGEGLEWCYAAHAEQNCIADAARTGKRVDGATLYLNREVPCKSCMEAIINAGIKKIVCKKNKGYDRYSLWLARHADIAISTV